MLHIRGGTWDDWLPTHCREAPSVGSRPVKPMTSTSQDAAQRASTRAAVAPTANGAQPAGPPLGVLLVQLGTPDSPETGDVRRYLREFLGDPRVLDMAAPIRALLLNAVILPFRPRKSAHAYRQIWTDEGSPLTIHTAELARKIAAELGAGYVVTFGMRYQQPALSTAIDELLSAGCERLIVFPLFPQYASASGGSAVARTFELVGDRWNVPDVTTIGAFYDDPGFLDAVVEVARPAFDDFHPDHVLFSYHGLPEQQIRKSDPSGDWCLTFSNCCDAIVDRTTAPGRSCYRAHSYATTRGLVARLGLHDAEFSTSFQSRLAGQKWIEPYTDILLPDLYSRGVRRLAVLTPSFIADCLETLEEIGIRLRRQWAGLGGDDMLLVPCVNASDGWSRAAADLVRRHARPSPLERNGESHPPVESPLNIRAGHGR